MADNPSLKAVLLRVVHNLKILKTSPLSAPYPQTQILNI
jgi:hypothetical protein